MKEPKAMEGVVVEYGIPSRAENIAVTIIAIFGSAVVLVMFAVAFGFRGCS